MLAAISLRIPWDRIYQMQHYDISFYSYLRYIVVKVVKRQAYGGWKD